MLNGLQMILHIALGAMLGFSGIDFRNWKFWVILLIVLCIELVDLFFVTNINRIRFLHTRKECDFP